MEHIKFFAHKRDYQVSTVFNFDIFLDLKSQITINISIYPSYVLVILVRCNNIAFNKS